MTPFNRSRPSPAELQARRVRWKTGASSSLARVIAGHVFGEAGQ